MRSGYEDIWSNQPNTALKKSYELLTQINLAITLLDQVAKNSVNDARKKAVKDSIVQHKMTYSLSILLLSVTTFLAIDLTKTVSCHKKISEIERQDAHCYDLFEKCAAEKWLKEESAIICWKNLEICMEPFEKLINELYDYRRSLYTPSLSGYDHFISNRELIFSFIIIISALIFFLALVKFITQQISQHQKVYRIQEFPPKYYLKINEQQQINNCLKQLDLELFTIDNTLTHHNAEAIKNKLIKIKEEIFLQIELLNGKRSKQSSLFQFFSKGEGAAMDIMKTHILPRIKDDKLNHF